MNWYEAFSDYPLHERVSGCPCCTGSDAALRRAPLQELSEDDLGRYAFKALTTWGNLADYKHFLPRILELCLQGAQGLGFDPAVIAGKLEMAEWKTWPEAERRAIETFFAALWSCPHHDLAELLQATGQARLPLEAHLAHCGASRLADLVLFWKKTLSRSQTSEPPILDAWLRQPERRLELETAFFASRDPEEQQRISDALWILESL